MRATAILVGAAVLSLVAATGARAQSNKARPAVHGRGTTNVVPLWLSSNTIGNSALSQSGGNLSAAGDFSAVGAGHFGSVSTDHDLTVGWDINLDATSASNVGVINLGGCPFMHTFGPSGLSSQNTFLGCNAGNFTLTGLDDTGGGALALGSLTSGTANTAFGTSALKADTTSGNNTAVGQSALQDDTTGHSNTALGSLAGVTGITANANVTGNNNTFIGFGAGPGTPTQLNDATAIGSKARVSASNAMVLGDSTIKVGIGTQAPKAKLQVTGGNIAITTPGTGLILKSPDGTKCARIGIDDTGAITVTSVACP